MEAWRQRPDMTIAVDWDVKHQFKQTNKMSAYLKCIDNKQLEVGNRLHVLTVSLYRHVQDRVATTSLGQYKGRSC